MKCFRCRGFMQIIRVVRRNFCRGGFWGQGGVLGHHGRSSSETYVQNPLKTQKPPEQGGFEPQTPHLRSSLIIAENWRKLFYLFRPLGRSYKIISVSQSVTSASTE